MVQPFSRHCCRCWPSFTLLTHVQHGQIKVRTSAEVAAAKAKERAERASAYVALREKTIAKRMAGEHDEKALGLCETILANNPDFSTIWNFRREILMKKFSEIGVEERQRVCSEELKFIESCIAKNPKSYNSWHQRRWVLLNAPVADWEQEIRLCTKFLTLDERNFHCWDYRRFVVSHMPDPATAAAAELQFSTDRISKNFSNYSAWHYRTKLLPAAHAGPALPADVLAKELDLVHNAFYIEPKDQSAWFFHRWLLGREDAPAVVVALHAAHEDDCSVTLAIVFSKPVALPPTQLSVALDGTTLQPTWRPCAAVGASALWLATLPGPLAADGKLVVQLVSSAFETQATSVTLSIPSPGVISTVRVCTDPAAALALWRPGQPDILEQELDVCRELLEVLDPGFERKWALLACLHIASALATPTARELCDSVLTQLLDVDPIRAGFYRDLHGRIAVNRIMTELLVGPPHAAASLAGRGLARLAVGPLLCGVRAVDLANNSLTSLSGVSALRFVHTIVLDDNAIETVADLTGLVALRRLSLQRNRIATAAALARLPPGLHVLFLFGNPIAASGNAAEAVAAAGLEEGVEVQVQERDVWALVTAETA